VIDKPDFTFVKYSDEYHIYHQGKKACVLRGAKADKFEQTIESCNVQDQQKLMAKLTGNYKRGNERVAGKHPRNNQ